MRILSLFTGEIDCPAASTAWLYIPLINSWCDSGVVSLFPWSLGPRKFPQQLASQPRDQRNGRGKRSFCGANPEVAIDLYEGRDGPSVRCLWPILWVLFAVYCLVLYVRKSTKGCYSGQATFMGSVVCQWHPFDGWCEGWETKRGTPKQKMMYVCLCTSLLATCLAKKVEE